MKLVAACALSLVAGASAFMAPSPSITRSAFAPAVGVQSRAKVMQTAPAKAGRLSLALRGEKSAVSKLHMGKVKAEYIWIGGRGGCGDDYRLKTRILDEMPKSIDDLPLWNYDGSSTGQAPGGDSEIFLKPAFMCHDPIRGGDSILVLCEMTTPDMKPIPTSTRSFANEIFQKGLDEIPWYGIEQEYTLFADGRPLGWPESFARSAAAPSPMNTFGFPGEQGPYYCSVGYDVAFGRHIVERHMDACLAAGVKIGGINGEVLPGQWEYQVGPCVGIEAGDHLHISRYLLHRICEEEGIIASFDPKPIPGEWNGAGCHTNFSTKKMREEGGYKVIIDACEKLGKNHKKHINLYGEGNNRRLTGKSETNKISDFRYAVADRGASIRLPRFTERDGKGYLEDRRPASNIDPYIVTALVFDTCCLKGDTTLFDNRAAKLLE